MGVGACITPLILDLGTRWRCVVNLTSRPLYPEESTPVPTEQETGWAPVIWTLCRKEKSLAPARNRTPDRPVHKSVTIPTYAMPALRCWREVSAIRHQWRNEFRTSSERQWNMFLPIVNKTSQSERVPTTACRPDVSPWWNSVWPVMFW